MRKLIVLFLILICGCSTPDPIYLGVDEQRQRIVDLTDSIENCLGMSIDNIDSDTIILTTDNFYVVGKSRAWGNWGSRYNVWRDIQDSTWYTLDSTWWLNDLDTYDIREQDFWQFNTWCTEINSRVYPIDSVMWYSWVAVLEIIPRWYYDSVAVDIGFYGEPPYHHVVKHGTATVYLPPQYEVNKFLIEMQDHCVDR